MSNALAALPLAARGKGKDMRRIPGRSGLLLQFFADRLSTHNVVHTSLIPGKGEIINAQSLFMCLEVFEGISTHLIAWGRKIYDYLPEGDYPPDLHYRAVIVAERKKPKYEFIRRRYLCGSLYHKHYKFGKDPYGLGLERGLPLMYEFAEPVFTPTEKSDSDDEVLYRVVEAACPLETALTAMVHEQGYRFLDSRGIRLIDEKAEAIGDLLTDDWLNGDCCRFALIEDICEGEEPPFLDKERFRKLAERKWGDGPKTPLTFSDEQIEYGIGGYFEAFERITGLLITDFRKKYLDS